MLWALARLWRGHCSGCDARLGQSARSCRKCGGFVVGEIAQRRDRLDAMERYEREQRHLNDAPADSSEASLDDAAASG